jgi:hypothetical protein
LLDRIEHQWKSERVPRAYVNIRPGEAYIIAEKL